MHDYEYYMKSRPHVVVMGIVVSCAVIPNSDKNGRKISVMNGFIEKLGLTEILEKIKPHTSSDNLEDIYICNIITPHGDWRRMKEMVK